MSYCIISLNLLQSFWEWKTLSHQIHLCKYPCLKVAFELIVEVFFSSLISLIWRSRILCIISSSSISFLFGIASGGWIIGTINHVVGIRIFSSCTTLQASTLFFSFFFSDKQSNSIFNNLPFYYQSFIFFLVFKKNL